MSSEDDDDDEPDLEHQPVVLEITDTLDLHPFAPREVKALVLDYLELAAEKGFAEVRIIHGKGKGVQRDLVRRICEKHLLVAGFRAADDLGGGGWGATIVTLRRS